MDFWKVDLTTRGGAERAARIGAIMSVVAGVFAVLGWLVVVLRVVPVSQPMLAPALVGIALELIVFLAAGFRLRAGKGLVWGGIAVLLLTATIIANLLQGKVVNVFIVAVLVVGLVNGVRGAWALRRDAFDDDTLADVFN